MSGYKKEEHYSPEALDSLKEHYEKVLDLIGEDSSREGLHNTSLREH